MADPVAVTKVGVVLDPMIESVESYAELDEKTGETTAVVSFTGIWPGALTSAFDITDHPDIDGLTREMVRVDRLPGTHAKISLTFRGVPDDFPDVVKTYNLQGSTSTEPIETHPDFKEFGGTPKIIGQKGTNDKGARFDEAGKFVGFAVEPAFEDPDPPPFGEDYRKAGVRSFLAASVTYCETAVFTEDGFAGAGAAELAVTVLGKIDDPPDSDLKPPDEGDFDWLLITLDAEEVGKGVRIRKCWRLSGSLGWDEDIYLP